MHAAKRMLAEKPMRSRGHQNTARIVRRFSYPKFEIATLARIFTAILIGTLAKPDSVSAAGAVSTAIHAAAHLPPVPADVLDSLNARPETQTKGRLQIGLGRTLPQPMVVNSRTVPASSWEVSSDGWHVLRLDFISEGGLGVRLHLEHVIIPANARLLLYDPAGRGNQTILTGQDFRFSREKWADTIFSSEVVLECQLPPEQKSDAVSFQVAELSHLYVLPQANVFTKEGTCHNDVSCYPNWASEASGVARISFIEHGNSYLCSGCLLATANGNNSADYFLTANHCVTGQSVAGTVEFFWFYQTATCNGPAPDITSVPHNSGSDLLAGSSSDDFAFLRMRQRAPGGAAHLSWSVNPPGDGESLTGIHHPDGSFKRISFGTTAGTSDDFWAVQWFDGVTEPGSSGSPLFNANHQVIGQLNGGFNGPGSSCNNPSAPDQYGRFDLTYNSVKRWLDSSSPPPGTDFSAVKGTYNGLFVDSSSGNRQNSSGLITVTLNAKGKFTAKLQIGAQRYSSAGQFDSNGDAQVQVRRRNLSPLNAAMHVDLANPSDQITGQVGDDSWTAPIVANLNVFNSMVNPSPVAGLYTLVIAGAPGSDNEPAGAGYATITADRAGRVNLAGSLADGTKISQSAYVSRDGEWPLYIALYGNGGSVLSWLSFSDDVHGDIDWIKPTMPARYYPFGFMTQRSANGSRYSRPTGTQPILNLSEGQLVLSGGDLDQQLIDNVMLGPKNKIVSADGAKLVLSFSASNGSFTGRLTNPSTLGSASFRGVVLQNQNIGNGYFLGPSKSGEVELSPY
jgi:hypothetical protein